MNQKISLLLTDLYQLTMLQGYYDQGMEDMAVFEFFIRKLPAGRSFLMAAGLTTVLQYLEDLHFTAEELNWLAECGRFSRGFIDYLEKMRFTGDVEAMAEGTIFFPHEPILRVMAPLPQAQFIESRILNLLHFQTLIASKAVRMTLAAPGKLLVDFGMRRAHGSEAALLAARSCYLAGLSGTATLLAEQHYGIPTFGTMAHSYVQAHDNEVDAFKHFALSHPDNVIFIIDTYDTESATEKIIGLAPLLKIKGITIKGVRLDSGDLAQHAKKVRQILDRGGLVETKIFASGNLDEYTLAELVSSGAPIDGFGIGTRMDTSSDAPYLDAAYKLQEYGGKVCRKRSEGKATLPGRKQVYRFFDASGKMTYDILTLIGDKQDGKALLKRVMSNGKRIMPYTPIEVIRQHAAYELLSLPESLKQLHDCSPYPVQVSEAINKLTEQVDAELR